MPREITTDGVIVIDHEELRGADVVSIFQERDRYVGWKRDGDRRIAILEATLREIATTYDETEQTPAKLSAALYSVSKMAEVILKKLEA